MQPDTSHSRGRDSHLFNSIQSYLGSQNRVQPIIGLASVIELCTDAEPPMYLCEVCVLKISKTDIKTHIIGSLHRYNYIRSLQVYGLKADADLTSLAWRLMELAKLVEKKEGTGNVQVLHLDEVIFKEMRSWPVLDVFAQVKEIKKQKHIGDFQSTICNKLSKCNYYPAAKTFTTVVSPAGPSSSRSSSLTQSKNYRSGQVPSLTRSSNPCRMLPGTPDLSKVQCPSRASSSSTTPTPHKQWNPIRAPGQNDLIQTNKANDGSRVIDTSRCIGTESNQTDTAQPTKRKCVAQCQNSSLTVFINQNTNQGSISCHESSQLIRTPANIQNQDEPLRNTDWVLNNSNVVQEGGHQLRNFTPEDPYFDIRYTGTQPLIGLQAVIKCQSVDGDPSHCSYLCQPCSLKVLKSDLIHHLTSPQHQLSYINFKHPHLLVGMGGAQSLHGIVMRLEQEEGRGQMKEMRISACCFSEILKRDYHWCMKMLNCGYTEEMKPVHGLSVKGHSITLKQSNESAGMILNHNNNGILHDPIEKVSLNQWRRKKKKKKKKKGVSLSKTFCKEPVFKVSLSLKEGPVVVDRMSLITTTVAPEIECQSPEPLYRHSDTLSEDITSGNHPLTPEYTWMEQSPEAFHNMELCSNEHVSPQDNIQSLGYTDAKTSSYEYMNSSQTGSLKRSREPESPLCYADHNSFVHVVSDSSIDGDSRAVELSSTPSETYWNLKQQPDRNNPRDQLTETDPVTQHSNNWPKNDLMFVQPEMTQVMFVSQAHQQMFRERNYEVMNLPMHTYPAATGAYVPAVNTFTSNPAHYVSQSWMWAGTTLPCFSNQYSLNPF